MKSTMSSCTIERSVVIQKSAGIPDDWLIWSNKRPDSLINDMANSPVNLALRRASFHHKLATLN